MRVSAKGAAGVIARRTRARGAVFPALDGRDQPPTVNVTWMSSTCAGTLSHVV